ncbi:hypothetical protein DFH28DRAFT_940219 [Melampsora americana]|nr:hypothetical protein DFH28DRAFT_940219 [Melampsora americana]
MGPRPLSLASPWGTARLNKVEVKFHGAQGEKFICRTINSCYGTGGNTVVFPGKLDHNIESLSQPWIHTLEDSSEKATNFYKILYIYLCPAQYDKWPFQKGAAIQEVQQFKNREAKSILVSEIRSFQKANVETLKRFIDKVQDATVLAKGGLGPMKISLETKEKSLAYKFKLTIRREDQDISMRDQCSTTEQSLGSVIIRLALAKMLSSEGFPILCLDGPTAGFSGSNHINTMQALIGKLSQRLFFIKRGEGNIPDLPRLLVTSRTSKTGQEDFAKKLCEKRGSMLNLSESNQGIDPITIMKTPWVVMIEDMISTCKLGCEIEDNAFCENMYRINEVGLTDLGFNPNQLVQVATIAYNSSVPP